MLFLFFIGVVQKGSFSDSSSLYTFYVIDLLSLLKGTQKNS